MISDQGIRDVTLRDMINAMSSYPNDAVFRWYQDSVVIPEKGWHQPTVTMRVTMGQVRKELHIPVGDQASQEAA